MRYGLRLAAFVVAAALVGWSSAGAQTVINFEEFPPDNANGPMPAGRYSYLGVTFSATDNGLTWAGISGGDPGNWGIEGTNGTTFSGFNGDSYNLRMLFAAQVSGFALDVSRSNGSDAVDTFTLEGWRGGVMVETHTVTLPTVNVWQTLSLAQSVDETRWIGNGAGFHPFGVDNVRFSSVPEPGTLALLGIGAVAAAGGWKTRQRLRRRLRRASRPA